MQRNLSRTLLRQTALSLPISLLFSVAPFALSLLLDKSDLNLAIFTAWYPALPPLVLLLLAWLLYRKEPRWAVFMGRVWFTVGLWFGLQTLFILLSPLHVLLQLLALPAITAGGKGFAAGAVILLLAGLLLLALEPRLPAARPPRRRTPLFAASTAALLILTPAGLPLLVALTCRPLPAGPPAQPPLPTEAEVWGYISDLYHLGARRPGSQADQAAIRYLEEKLRSFGFQLVYVEPFQFDYWEPVAWSLTVGPNTDSPWQPETFYVPYSGPTGPEGVTAGVVYVGEGTEPDFASTEVAGKIILVDLFPVDIGWDQMKLFSFMAYDPEKTAAGWSHPYPIGWMFRYLDLYQRAARHGAAGIIGILHDYPDMGAFTYYAPYDGTLRAIPSLYVMEDAGALLRQELAAGPLEARMVLQAQVSLQGGETATVYGLLPGRSDTVLMVHSHHDAPWASGVEDSSGVGMVLALARYFAQVPATERARTMVFVFTGSHMVGAPSNEAFIEAHQHDLMARTLFDLCIEHIADDYNPPGSPSGLPEPRGTFITENPVVVSLYAGAVAQHQLIRTLLFPTGTPLGVPTDAGPFSRAGYPVVSLISGPTWLFDDDDTLERVARDQLEPLARMYVDFIGRLNRMPDPLLRFNLNVWTVILTILLLTPLATLSALCSSPAVHAPQQPSGE